MTNVPRLAVFVCIIAMVVAIVAFIGSARAEGPPEVKVVVTEPLPLPVTATEPLPVQGSLGVTGDVNITNTPTVNAQQSGPWNVGINGTPSVNVANTASVTLAGAVELAADSTVSVANSASAPLFVQQVASGPEETTPAELLPPTGRTIAGPALLVPTTTATIPIWRNNTTPFQACATIVNTGSRNLVFTAGGVLPLTVVPGASSSRCDNIITSSFYGLACSGSVDGCAAVWRVDRL